MDTLDWSEGVIVRQLRTDPRPCGEGLDELALEALVKIFVIFAVIKHVADGKTGECSADCNDPECNADCNDLPRLPGKEKSPFRAESGRGLNVQTST